MIIARQFPECMKTLDVSIQEKINQKPDIPGLTAVGFERWMTLLIQAHLGKEYRRLEKAVLNMPISNPENREILEISRRFFPHHADLRIREHVECAFAEHADVQFTWSLNRKERQSHHEDTSTLNHMCSPLKSS